MRLQAVLLAALLLAASGVSAGWRQAVCGPSVPGAPTNATSGTNVVDLLCHRNEQSVVLEMLARTGMTIWLSEPQQLSTATLFLPKNSAVRAAVKEMNMTVDELMVDEQLLSQILAYHIVPNVALWAANLTDGQQLTTLAGQDLTVELPKPTATLRLNTTTGQTAKIIKTNFTAGDAVVHVVNDLLIPKPEAKRRAYPPVPKPGSLPPPSPQLVASLPSPFPSPSPSPRPGPWAARAPVPPSPTLHYPEPTPYFAQQQAPAPSSVPLPLYAPLPSAPLAFPPASSPAPAASITSRPSSAPSPIIPGSVFPRGDALEVTFGPPADSGSSAIIAYLAIAVPSPGTLGDPGNPKAAGPSSPLRLTGLLPGVPYTVYVTAGNADARNSVWTRVGDPVTI